MWEGRPDCWQNDRALEGCCCVYRDGCCIHRILIFRVGVYCGGWEVPLGKDAVDDGVWFKHWFKHVGTAHVGSKQKGETLLGLLTTLTVVILEGGRHIKYFHSILPRGTNGLPYSNLHARCL